MGGKLKELRVLTATPLFKSISIIFSFWYSEKSDSIINCE